MGPLALAPSFLSSLLVASACVLHAASFAATKRSVQRDACGLDVVCKFFLELNCFAAGRAAVCSLRLLCISITALYRLLSNPSFFICMGVPPSGLPSQKIYVIICVMIKS